MAVQVIVLNGGSSSGKSGIVRCLQAVLPVPWLAFGVDRLIEAMPVATASGEGGVAIGADGSVRVGPAFDRLQSAWMAGVAATARAGAGVIIDDVFLGGALTQRNWAAVLDGLGVLWVGVRCDAEVAAAREVARGDRAAGMARSQAELVHRGVRYDLEVDTTHREALDCARAIAARAAAD
ncbi:chloramphenicol phosphotransferase CPT [Dactylosporangium vinaceum]|uniref:Chloramphenicol phosphotransferase CPT n=1 Tax=Dactylosporangium vinaceum TaxID=53362 RepID=A0ABV5MD66_9ACTN|nr:chloramphenicol phosphotransferase CPT [Dactylosporangium vinaceum]UAC00855.1 chloramphenicol phosphotransferase CPT [Dactylosporangium vinaceum]